MSCDAVRCGRDVFSGKEGLMKLDSSWVWVIVGMGLVSCEGGGSSEAGYVLMDREARASGISLRKDDAAVSAALPVAVGEGESAVLVADDAAQPLSVDAGELLYVRGADAQIDRLVLGRDVESDAWDIDGSAAASEELAYGVGGRLMANGERMRLQVPDAVDLVSALSVPPGLVEFSPVPIAQQDALGSSTSEASEPAPSAATAPDVRAAVLARIAGTWRGQGYSPFHEAWYEATITIRLSKDSPQSLEGVVIAHSWTGLPDNPKAPTKCNGQEQWKVREPALGSVRADGTVQFDSQSWSVERAICGAPPAPGDYYLDRFAGALNAEGTEWSALANDSYGLVDWPVTLRRIGG
jgi:hypothetical protein